MINSDIKECPFCNKKPSFKLKGKTSCQMHGDPIQYTYLKCSNQNCFVNPSVDGGDIYANGASEPFLSKGIFEAREKAIIKWNKRGGAI